MWEARLVAAGLLEREGEVRRLRAALTEADDGCGRMVVVRGPAGVGKTTLLDTLARAAESPERLVLKGRGTGFEGAFGVAEQLFSPALRGVDASTRAQWLSGAAGLAGPAVAGAAPPPGGPPSVEAVLHGLYWLTSAMAQDAPVVLLVDDLQWVDEETLRFLVHLRPRLGELAVLVLATLRTGEPSPAEALLDALTDGADTLEPAPLGVDAVRSAVRARLGEPDPGFARECHTATGGNPLLLRILLTELEAAGTVPDASAATRLTELGARGASDTVRRRLRSLGDDALDVAHAVAVLGHHADAPAVAALARLDLDRVRATLDELRAADVLDADDTPRFVHPIVQDAVLEWLGPAARAALHGRAAEILDQAGASPSVVARHVLLTDRSGDPRRIAVLRRAAASALERGSPSAALPLLERAVVEQGGTDPAERGALLLELGTAELRARAGSPVVHLREALALAPDLDARAEVALRLTMAELWHADYSSGVADVETVIAEAEAAGRDDLARRLSVRTMAKTAIDFQSSDRLIAFGSRHAAAHLDPDDPDDQVLAGLLANFATFEGRPAPESIELAAMATSGSALLRRAEDGDPAFMLALNILVQADALDLATERLNAAIDLARRRNHALLFATATGLRCHVHFRRGDLLAAEADGRFAVSATTYEGFAIPTSLGWLAWALVERGAAEEAGALLADEGLLGELPQTLLHNVCFAARFWLKLHGRNPRGAVEDALEIGRRQVDRGAHRNIVLPWRSWAAEAHTVLGERDAALPLVEEELALAQEWGVPRAIGIALRARGLALEGEAGIAGLEEALGVLRTSPARLEEARTLVDLGLALRHAKRRVEAREVLQEGLALAERCGAARLCARARDELAASGAKLRRSAATGAASLTPSERRVCDLAVEGLSNAEIAQALFVSRKTVEKHLGQSYRKLDVSSRDALAEALSPVAGPA